MKILILIALLFSFSHMLHASGGEITLQEKARDIKTIVQVKILKAETKETRKTLRSGKPGPVLSIDYVYQVELEKVVLGGFPEKLAVAFGIVYHWDSMTEYDDDGKEILRAWRHHHETGIESSLKVNESYLVFFQYSPAKPENYFVWFADEVKKLDIYLETIGDQQLWEQFYASQKAQKNDVLLG